MAKSDSDNKLSRAEAGKLGGDATARKQGKDFYETIGEEGGETTVKKYGTEHMADIGRKGGQRGNESEDFGERVQTKDEMIREARDAGIKGYSRMNKTDLGRALDKHPKG